MISQAEKILAKGLKSGYAGESTRHEIARGPFTLKATELAFPKLNATYNDHWIAKRTGGGQEIAQADNEMVTRLFAGGIVSPKKLQKLGIHEAQVLSYLKTKLAELADKTRLHENIESEADGDWQYSYKILEKYPDVPVTVGVESIQYKGQDVFIHVFLNTPIV